MKNKLLISVAAIALIAGGGLASAQGMKEQKAPAAAQSGPAAKGGDSSVSGAIKGGPALKETTGQASSESKAGADVKKSGADTKMDTRTDMKHPRGTTGQSSSDKTDMKSKSDIKADTKAEKNGSKADIKARSDNKADVKSGSSAKSDTKSDTKATTGQGAAGSQGAVNLSTEQRTKIKTVIKEKSHVRPVTNVNFSISIGTRVPRTVHLYPLPVEVISVYPSWRGYEFILVGDEIVVINPRTLEIVAVIEA